MGTFVSECPQLVQSVLLLFRHDSHDSCQFVFRFEPHSSDSDLDLLIVTPQKRRLFAAGLDCVLIAPEEIDSSFWLGSELASHIAKYGNWIKGPGEWRDRKSTRLNSSHITI